MVTRKFSKDVTDVAQEIKWLREMVTRTGTLAYGPSGGLVTPTPRSCDIDDMVEAAVELIKRSQVTVSTAATDNTVKKEDNDEQTSFDNYILYFFIIIRGRTF